MRNATRFCLSFLVGVLIPVSVCGQGDQKEYTVDELVELLRSSDKYVRADAAARLADHESDYKKFVGPLSELLTERDEVLNDTATRIFRRLGVKAVDALNPDFDTTDPVLIRRLCSAIHAAGDSAERYKPELVERLANEEDRNRRLSLTYALTGFSNGCPEAIEHILGDLEHDNMNVTLFACRLVIKTGDKAHAAVPNVKKLLEDGVISQRGYAAWALAAIGPNEHFDALPAIGKMLDSFYVMEKERALIALGVVGDKAAEYVPRVRELMNEPGSNLQGQAAVTLWQITGEADDSVKVLIKITSNSVDFELSGLRYLGQMGSAASDAVDFLAERSQYADPSIQVLAVDALGRIGPAAACKKDNLKALLNDPDALVRFATREALERILEQEE